MQNSQKTEFSFLQWNTLNSEYSNIEAFPKADPKILTWDYRKPLIEEDLKKIQADIICLEEVNAGDFEFFKSVFQDKYDSTYQKKGKSSEGLCFLYSKEKFEGMIQPKLESYIDADGKPQSYVYQVHILKLKNKENHFLIVGLTHLHPLRREYINKNFQFLSNFFLWFRTKIRGSFFLPLNLNNYQLELRDFSHL